MSLQKLEPVAFLSYTRFDDEHEGGRISSFRERLEGEMRMITGKSFSIFQDRKDIKWGQEWKRRLEETLLSVTFLIPIITPSYFQSQACQDEFNKFLSRENQLGENRLILPIYYVDADIINSSGESRDIGIAKIIASRNWEDWRSVRFQDLQSPEMRLAIAKMALTIKSAMAELEGVIAAAQVSPETANIEVSPSQAANPRVSLLVPEFKPNIREKKVKREVFVPEYKVFTKKYDEVVQPKNLIDAVDLLPLKQKLGVELNIRKREKFAEISAFEAELQRKDYSDVSVTFLIDNSGSMRGEKISACASWIYIISECLAKFRVAHEIVGFTTRAWKGGRSREDWLNAGQPENPGRLNDVRYIVYKGIDGAVTNDIALMYREGILKENIDGEALLWAYDRNQHRIFQRWLLLVISDGAPVDDSTLAANYQGILEDHLKDAIKFISEDKDVILQSIGLQFDVSRYYEKSVVCKEYVDLGAVVMKLLSKSI